MGFDFDLKAICLSALLKNAHPLLTHVIHQRPPAANVHINTRGH
jgi:hypothetical protein